MSARARLKAAYRQAYGAAVVAGLPLRHGGGEVRVFYGGARGGALGGPLVKIGLLRQRFPEHRFDFSLLYQLSNAIYLSPFAWRAMRARGVPIVLNQNGVFYRGWYPHGWQDANAVMARAHALATHVLYQSAFCRDCAIRFLGPRQGGSEILHNAVDTARFTPATAERPPGPAVVLMTGKIAADTAYRVQAAIEALAAARRQGLEVTLRVAGHVDAPVLGSMRALADAEGVAAAVAFTGAYDRAQAPDVYRDADVYLMTKHNDPCPNVVLEAMASGLPVVYSRSGGVPELVGDEAGVALSVEDTFETTPSPPTSAIVAGLARALAQREAMARAARARAVARFDVTPWLDRHARLFAQLVAAR